MSELVTEALAILDSRDESWRKEILALYSEGATDREVMFQIGLMPNQWRALEEAKVDTDFAEIIEVGRVLMRSWWEALGRKNLTNPKFQTALYKFMMGSHFGWSEKSETSMTQLDFGNMDDGDLMRLIKDLNARLGMREKTTL